MWTYVARRLAYSVPLYLGIMLLLMACLRVRDPVYAYLGKNASEEQIAALRASMGLDEPFLLQYAKVVGSIFTLDFGNSWKYAGTPVRDFLVQAIPVTVSITVPEVVLATIAGVCIGLISAYFRGRVIDRVLVILAVLGMSISYVVYIIFGQVFGAYLPQRTFGDSWPLAIHGYEPWVGTGDGGFFVRPGNWVRYCLLPVLIGVVVEIGYDTRFFRAVMVEEATRDHITTARAKGASKRRIMFVHMLKNAMIPIITRVMTALPFLITGSILLEAYFRIPGMGYLLISSINDKDLPVVQGAVALFAAFFLLSITLTDVLYALVDPRVRLS
jgi:peptide/nickel transport system permease protein